MTKLTNRQLRYNGVPRTLMEYAILKSPNETVTIFHLEWEGIKTSRNFSQIAYSAGFSGLVKKHFLPFCGAQGLKIVDKIVLKSADVRQLINDIEQRKARRI